jgi:arabinose-5-phosphate isomerase
VKTINKDKICELAQQVINTESQAVLKLRERIDDSFVKACELILACQGHVVVIGMGKSGHIANKIAATFASTGTPAFFVHPGEASHGDLGMITKNDVVLAISNSGNTEEILAILPLIKNFNIPLLTLTGKTDSKLAKAANVNLDVSVDQEACHLGIIPTSSTTATLVMGDALAVVLASSRGFTQDDFAKSHPGGLLGRRLLLKIDDLMHTGTAIPKVLEDVTLAQALLEMTAKKLGMTTIVNKQDQLQGVFTDGDLRRVLDKNLDLRSTKIADVMVRNCKTITVGTLAWEALRLMEKHNITALVVLDKVGNLAGVVHMHDILKAGL